MAGLLFLSLCTLALSNLALSSKNTIDTNQECKIWGKNKLPEKIAPKNLNIKTLLYVKPVPNYINLAFALEQSICLGKHPQLIEGFTFGEWNEVRFYLDRQGFHVFVNGQEMLNIARFPDCQNTDTVEVYVGRETFFSIGCDPRIFVITSTTKLQTTNTVPTPTATSSPTSTSTSTPTTTHLPANLTTVGAAENIATPFLILQVQVAFVIIGVIGSFVNLAIVVNQDKIVKETCKKVNLGEVMYH